MGNLTTREDCMHLRVVKRNAVLKGHDYYRPTRKPSTKRRKTIAENNAIIKRLKEEL
jgi:hypothetical protein